MYIELEGGKVDLTKPITDLTLADRFLCEMMEKQEVAEYFHELDIHECLIKEEILAQTNFIREKYLQVVRKEV